MFRIANLFLLSYALGLAFVITLRSIIGPPPTEAHTLAIFALLHTLTGGPFLLWMQRERGTTPYLELSMMEMKSMSLPAIFFFTGVVLFLMSCFTDLS